MINNRVIPVLLLRNLGFGMEKTINFKNPKYVGDCLNAVKIFNEKLVDELIILDYRCSTDGREPDYKKINSLATECFMPLSYGGGISSLDQAKKIFNQGIEKIIINTHSTNYKLIEDISKVYGSQSIIVSLDYKKNFFGKIDFYLKSGNIKIKSGIETHIENLKNSGVGEIIIQSIDKEGTMKGYDYSLFNKIGSLIDCPLIALGGASGIDDFTLALRNGADAVAGGSYFIYYGKHKAVLINYPTQQEINKIINDE
tara:strand:+ start:34 stop:801 length:768 start_codon:yes stop_codon:yes gene_type:complete